MSKTFVIMIEGEQPKYITLTEEQQERIIMKHLEWKINKGLLV